MIIRSTLYRWCFTALATTGVLAAGCGDDSNKAKNDAGVPKDGTIDAKFDETATLTIAPLTSNFGTITVGQSSAATAFTVTNSGTGTSDQVQVNLSGSSDYHIASNTCVTLAPSATCTIGIIYSPSSAGATTASLLVSVTGSSATSMLSGTGGAIGNITVSPPTFAFANATVGATGTDSDTITVTNPGGQSTGALTVQAVGSDPTQFTKTADTCNGMVLASGASCSITVKFSPTSAGAKSAGYSIIGNPGGTATASFSGNAATDAQLAINPSAQNFGSVVKGQTSSTVSVNVANVGGSTSGALTSAISGANAADFSIVTNTCTGTLAATSACQLTLRYVPSILGAETATLTVSGTPGGSVTTSLTGTGVSPGGLTVNPTSFTYASTQVGAASTTKSFTVTNSGGTSVGPVVINLSGSDAGEFNVVAGSDLCTNTTLTAGGTCTFGVAFTPSTAGSKSANAVISGNGNSITAALIGLATPSAQLAITPTSRDFGTNGIGTTSSPLTFTVSNGGGAATTVPAIALSGANANQFAQTNNCTTALAPGANCTVSVTFSPTAVGNDTATITATAATGGTVSANVFGIGANPAQLTVIPGNLSFDGELIGQPDQQQFTVQNNGSTATGAVTVTISSSGIGGNDFSQTNTCTTIPAGGTCTVTVTYSPTSSSANATATVTATPGGSATVALSGNAVPPVQLVSINAAAPKSPYDFGNVFVGVAPTATLLLKNNSSHFGFTNSFNTGSDAAYSVLSQNCNSVAPGNQCTVVVQFAPTNVGVKNASLAISAGSGSANTTTVSFTGNAVPSITITAATSADFGNVVINTTSPTLKFIVKNNANVTVGQPLATALNAPFAVTQGTCAGSLSPGNSCQLNVTFHPTTLGPAVTTLTVTSNPGGSASIDLHGTGVDASNMQLIPNSADFGTVVSGGTPVVKTFVLQNPAGAQTSGPLAITLTGGSEYTILTGDPNDCAVGGTVANGLSCNIRVQFAPRDEVGSTTPSAQLNVQANPGAVSPGISASLTGATSSKISISPTSHDFGALVAGNSATTSFTVTNVSSGSVTFAAPSFTGTATDLSVSANTCSTLAAGLTCTVTVKFAPVGADNDNAILVVALTNGEGHANATITATSTAPNSILYDQNNGHQTDGTQNGLASDRALISYFLVADDFVVPASGWTLNGVDATFYFNATTTYNIAFYTDAPGHPGSLIVQYSNLSYTILSTGSEFGFSLDSIHFDIPATSFVAGHYWMSIDGNNSSQSTYWASRGVTLNDPMQTTDCTQGPWANANACATGMNDTEFALHGFAGGGPTALPHYVPQYVYPQPMNRISARKREISPSLR